MAHDALTADFSARCRSGSDIFEHLPGLSALAQNCTHVTEFGVRSGNSTIALLHGLANAGAGTLESYDRNPPDLNPPPATPPFVSWVFHQADTSALPEIAPTDFLFIDTLHTADQVRAELRHAPQVKKYLAFHDTVLFGLHDESPGTGPGILQAIWEFLATEEGQKWFVAAHAPNNNGLLVLRRRFSPPSKKGART